MLQIIEQHASPNDWIAFDDAPLTGHVTTALPAKTLALSDSDLQTLAIAATRNKSWISFGAIRREVESSSTLPIVEFDSHKLALIPVDATETTLAQCAERGIDIVITMGSGAQCTLAPTHPLSPSLLMHVQAASPWQPPGCHADGIGKSQAVDALGNVIAECPSSGEHVLILAAR
jgi:hypothetical protein